MDKSFYRIEDLMKLLNVSRSTASRKLHEIMDYYGLNNDPRLPTQSCIPVSLFNDYYDFSDKLKNGARKENTK